VKINDPKYARKYGIAQLPAVVYFRKKFPSIFRGININININISLLSSDQWYFTGCLIEEYNLSQIPIEKIKTKEKKK